MKTTRKLADAVAKLSTPVREGLIYELWHNSDQTYHLSTISQEQREARSEVLDLLAKLIGELGDRDTTKTE